MQFLQLNNDVILEIFLQFVAIDWDGPFTLMLVCTKWSNLVLSKPRAWTWIMIDETQAEWRERMEVSAYLSQNLPLQIVLRFPFESQVSLSHITRRCSSLFLDSKPLEDNYFFKNLRSWEKTIVSYKEFTNCSAELKQSNDSLLNFFKGVPIQDIQIRSEDQRHASFAYSAWNVYERLNQGASIQEVLTSGETLLITALVFKHSESAPLPRIQVLVTDLWALLPCLSNLCYLELTQNYIRVPKNTRLAHITLRSLLTMKIEFPMRGSVFFSLKDDVWLGPLSILETIMAPNLEYLSLHGPLHRIVAAMIKNHGRFHLLQLSISISVFDETLDQDQINKKLVWHGLRQCTVDIPEQNKARPQPDSELVDALRLLFNLIPRQCSVQLHGGAILEPVMQSSLLMDVELHLVVKIDNLGDVYKPLRWPRKIKALSVIGEDSLEPKRVPWISSVEELWADLDCGFIYPNGPSLPVRVLEGGAYTGFQQEPAVLSDGTVRDSFSNLTDLKCDEDMAMWMITNQETPRLRSLILIYISDHSKVFDVLEKASHRLLSLDTLGICRSPDWHELLSFVAIFNRSCGRGISTMKLEGLPHPAILHHLGRAFRGEVDQPDTLDNVFMSLYFRMKRRYPHGCNPCELFGWSCYDRKYCSRWWLEDMVTITSDMPLAKYQGDWQPDGQGWRDNLGIADESDINVEHEGAEVTNETSVE